MPFLPRLLLAVLALPALAQAQASNRRPSANEPKVGPPHGTVIVVGGGGMGPEVYSRFIEAAGGPDALIIDVPNAGGGDSYGQDIPSIRGWKTAGAKNVHVLFTKDRKLADTDSFVAVIKQAGGVWFEGGRQFHLVDDYGGTKTEQAFRDVLARGGVVGGSSAGASILGDFLVRGAPSSNNRIMDYPDTRRASRICAALESTSTSSRANGCPISPTPSSRSTRRCSRSPRMRGRRGS
jgi:cyanophycinase-like exopeptidase